jgi:hypothetical protein
VEAAAMMIPTVHLNGTGKKNLLAELETAYAAVGAALEALRQVTVHGRDYYVQGEHAYGQARTEMDARLAALAKVRSDLHDLHIAVAGQ